MTTKISDVKREKHEINAEGVVLGRLATKVANLLMGKSKPYFTHHLDCGDFVTLINAGKVKITGKKDQTKLYTHYSGYPGGLKTKNLKTMRDQKPGEVVRLAVLGMLPKNKLQAHWIARLTINV